MSTITVKQYVMLLTAQSIITTCSWITPDTCSGTPYYPYKATTPIPRIVCADGTSLSVQAHGGCHAIFNDVKQRDPVFSMYSPKFGKDLAMCETDCEELDQYGIDTIEDIEEYVTKHGGIDIEATMSLAVDTVIKCLERYK